MLALVGSKTVRLDNRDQAVIKGDIGDWLREISDPHEFATSFVNWAEANPDKRGVLFPLLIALDYWLTFETLEGFTG